MAHNPYQQNIYSIAKVNLRLIALSNGLHDITDRSHECQGYVRKYSLLLSTDVEKASLKDSWKIVIIVNALQEHVYCQEISLPDDSLVSMVNWSGDHEKPFNRQQAIGKIYFHAIN